MNCLHTPEHSYTIVQLLQKKNCIKKNSSTPETSLQQSPVTQRNESFKDYNSWWAGQWKDEATVGGLYVTDSSGATTTARRVLSVYRLLPRLVAACIVQISYRCRQNTFLKCFPDNRAPYSQATIHPTNEVTRLGEARPERKDDRKGCNTIPYTKKKCISM